MAAGTIALNMIMRTNQFQRDINKTKKSVNSLNNRFKNFAKSLMAIAGVGGGMYMLRRTLISSVQEFASVDKVMAKISTMLDKQSMHLLPKYRTELTKFSKKYGEAFGTLGEGLYDILSAQVDPAKALNLLEVSTRSAIGGFTDAGTTTALTTSILKAYGWQIEKATRVQDILHATVRQGKFRFEDLGSQLGNVIGLAAKLNVDLEAVGAALATMTKAGVPAEKMVMALRNIFNQFLYPSEAARQAAKELGFELDSTSIQGAGLVNVMDKLSGASARQLKVLMPTMRGITGFAAMLKNAKNMGIDYEKIVNNIGLANENLAKATENASWKIDQLKMKWKSFKVDVGADIWDLGTNLKMISEGFKELKNVQIGPDIVFREPSDEIKKAAQKTYREITKEFNAFNERQSVGLRWRPGEIIQPKDENFYRKLLIYYQTRDKKLLEAVNQTDLVKEAEKFGKYLRGEQVVKADTEGAKAQIESAREQMEWANKVVDNWHKNETKKLNITAGLYEDMGDYGIEYQNLYERLLDEQIREYRKTVKDEVLLEKWKKNQLDNIETQRTEFAKQKQYEQYLASDKIADGFRAASLQMQDDLYTWGEIGSGVAMSVRDSMANAFYDMTINSEDFVKSFTRSIASAMARLAAMQIATGIMSGIGGALGFKVGEYHKGGQIGSPSGTRLVSPDVFLGARRAHDGLDLRTKEVPIIATEDESVVKTSSLKQKVPTLNIYNQTGQPFEATQPEFDGEKWVLSVVAKNVRMDGNFRKMLRG